MRSPGMIAGEPLEGFWLPAGLRDRTLHDADWQTVWLLRGALLDSPADGAIAVRWPRLTPSQAHALLAGLQRARCLPPAEVATRWEAAFAGALAAGSHPALWSALSAATGYSEAMLATALANGAMLTGGRQAHEATAQSLARAMNYRPPRSLSREWAPYGDQGGRIRFYPRGTGRALAALRPSSPLYRPAPPIDLALGYAAGNVPGTALLIALLAALANDAAARGVVGAAPAVLIRNSRHEPLFAPIILSAIEAIDPELVAAIAVLTWDYDDPALQRVFMQDAGLLIAAAGDDTIAALAGQRARLAPRCRFHAHGHKASFAIIGDPAPQTARLAALDTALWDQNGCLSARIHFVLRDPDGYAEQLTAALRSLAAEIPRGATPRRFVHRAFDAYSAIAQGATAPGQAEVRVCSRYEDDFAVILDRRPWDPDAFRRAVNVCQGRVVIVRPVRTVAEAAHALAVLPPANLQSVSTALDPAALIAFADQAGAAGVTALRPLGRAAFPQLAGSWDGFLPLDVAWLRPAGHFTTVELDPAPGPLSRAA